MPKGDIPETVNRLHSEFSMLERTFIHDIVIKKLIDLDADGDLENEARHDIRNHLAAERLKKEVRSRIS